MGSEDRKASSTAIGFIPIIAIALLVGVYLSYTLGNGNIGGTLTTTTPSTTTIDGIVTGVVTVGPSQPVCSVNQSCNVNMSGYSLEFTSQCPSGSPPSSCQAQSTSKAALSPSGHYSILLPAGTYSVSGLYPSCNWVGCSSAFPKTVVVQEGTQIVFNVDIDTGIR